MITKTCLYIYTRFCFLNMNNDKINDLILRYLSGECTPDDEEELLAWSNSSNENSNYFQNIKYTWLAAEYFREEPTFEVEDGLHKLELTLTSKTTSGSKHQLSKSFSYSTTFRKALKYAAIYVLVFLTGGISSFILYRTIVREQKAVVCYYEVPIGSKGIAVLPDGSHVWLNAGSKLSYATNYNSENRTVTLTGEGFFDVITNPKKPFIVKAKGLDIKAYGTAFNVKAYKEDKEVVTTLVRGKVIIEGKDEKNKSFTIQMKPKQTAICLTVNHYYISYRTDKKPVGTYDREEMANPTQETTEPVVIIDKVKTELFTSWKDKRWLIENARFLDLLKELERRYNVSFLINSEELKKYHFSGTIQDESIEQVMSILQLTLPVKYFITKNQIEIKIDQELMHKYRQAM